MPTDLLSPDPLSHPSRQPPRQPPAASHAEDEVDPELLALPSPPRAEQRWTVALLVLVAVTASAMGYALRGEAVYSFQAAVHTGAAADIGELYSVDLGKVADNRYVQGHGALGGALAVRFERPFEGDTYRVSPVMGRRDLWVETRIPSGREGARYVPPTSFSGRLVRWNASGLRYRGLASAVERATGEAVPSDARLLIDGESPGDARWALGLALMFTGFAVWSLVTMARLLRRVREA